jgi:hypothetical protein
MRKLLSLLGVGVILGLLGPAWATAARADEPTLRNIIVPPFAFDDVSADITGKLEMHLDFPVYVVPLSPAGGRRLPAVRWQIQVQGRTFDVDLGTNKDIQALASKLNGKMVVLSGSLTGNRVRVGGLRAAAALAVPQVQIEIVGTLRYSELERFPVLRVWEVTANGQTYRLSLPTAELQKRGQELSGRRVMVRGTLQGDRVTVTHLTATPIRFGLAAY